MSDEEIVSKPIYDKSGKLIGNVTGRKEHVDKFSRHDLLEQINVDNKRHKENLKK